MLEQYILDFLLKKIEESRSLTISFSEIQNPTQNCNHFLIDFLDFVSWIVSDGH